MVSSRTGGNAFEPGAASRGHCAPALHTGCLCCGPGAWLFRVQDDGPRGRYRALRGVGQKHAVLFLLVGAKLGSGFHAPKGDALGGLETGIWIHPCGDGRGAHGLRDADGLDAHATTSDSPENEREFCGAPTPPMGRRTERYELGERCRGAAGRFAFWQQRSSAALAA